MRALIYLWHDQMVSMFYRMDDVRQRRRCEAQAATRGWPVVEVLVDAASEPAGARPALERLRVAVQRHACEVVIIPALICLGPQVEGVLAFVDQLARAGVELIRLHEAFDTTLAHGSYALLLLRSLARG